MPWFAVIVILVTDIDGMEFDSPKVFAKGDLWEIGAITGMDSYVDLIFVISLGLGDHRVELFSDLLNCVLGDGLALFDYFCSSFRFEIFALESILAPLVLLEVIWDRKLNEGVDELIAASVPLPFKHIPFQDVVEPIIKLNDN